MREKDSVNGKEFVTIRNDCENVKEQIMREIQIAEGELADEVFACKEINHKMINKYKTKFEKYLVCVELKKNKKDEFTEDW